MQITPTTIPDLLILEPRVHGDHRGYFMETWRQSIFAKHGLPTEFVQDNQSKSEQGILRGLHYQLTHPQGKLVRVISGEIFDVAVDLRRSSATFGQWDGVKLSSDNRRQLWVPPGFAHGFYVLSDSAEVVYKCTDYYVPEDERGLLWNDPELDIEWPLLAPEPVLSDKDRAARLLKDAELYP
ncbi:MAG: dTDP-4-dehydrorhamnose 3,5-epimerase [Pseudohongiellaceae bacterium]